MRLPHTTCDTHTIIWSSASASKARANSPGGRRRYSSGRTVINSDLQQRGGGRRTAAEAAAEAAAAVPWRCTQNQTPPQTTRPLAL